MICKIKSLRLVFVNNAPTPDKNLFKIDTESRRGKIALFSLVDNTVDGRNICNVIGVMPDPLLGGCRAR